MRPELFSLFGVPFHAYRTMLAVSVLVCTLLAVRESRRRNLGFILPPQTGVWALMGALIGAKLFWAVQNAPVREWWRALLLWEGGLVFYGGLLGGVLASWAYFRRVGIPFLPAADTMAPYVALGEAFTRIGCFFNGCCWGASTRMPWGVRFPSGCAAYEHAAASGLLSAEGSRTVPLHPTQLYMVLGLLMVFALVKAVLARQRVHGRALAGYLAAYAVVRSVVEVFRDDSPRYAWGLTPAQFISLALLVAAALLTAWQSRLSRNAVDRLETR